MSFLILWQVVISLVCLFLGIFIYDKRFESNHGKDVPDGFERTNEVNIDPVTEEKTRVYYNPETGKRYYKKEK